MSKLAIVVGHNSKARGAVMVTTGAAEYDWNTDLAKMICTLARPEDNVEIAIFNRLPGLPYWQEIDNCYMAVDAWGADCSIELHFNGSTSAKAEGCATLSSGSQKSSLLAAHLQEKMVGTISMDDDGVIKLKRQDRGGRSLHAGRAPAVLIEPFFGSNHTEATRADQRKPLLAEVIYLATINYVKDVS